MNASDFKVLSETTTEGFDVKKLDRVYNEILVPRITRFAKELKRSRVEITDNTYCNKASNLMKELFNDKFSVQTLIESEMKPYLIEKGFNVVTCSPSYYVAICW